ncbi:hypothetical protein OAK74_02340, partial [bacterium]|nr:hypothetical protein [bacterium]
RALAEDSIVNEARISANETHLESSPTFSTKFVTAAFLHSTKAGEPIGPPVFKIWVDEMNQPLAR